MPTQIRWKYAINKIDDLWVVQLIDAPEDAPPIAASKNYEACQDWIEAQEAIAGYGFAKNTYLTPGLIVRHIEFWRHAFNNNPQGALTEVENATLDDAIALLQELQKVRDQSDAPTSGAPESGAPTSGAN